jgi:misacylated tRNA(Ala) deacylase
MTEEIFRNDAYVKTCDARVVAVDEHAVQLDRTVFYPMGGGQPGDRGVLRHESGEPVQIVDTRKGATPGEILHITEAPVSESLVGHNVVAEIDWERRYRLMRMHTCLHLLCAVIPAGVTGGSIRDGSGRLDFDLPESTLDKAQVTEALNRLIAAGHAVQPRWITDDELAQKPDLVRTMSVAPPMGHGRVRLLDIAGVDLQPCGGTHVANTGEIGRVRVTKIEKKGKHNRRVNIEFDT